ncbi:MAG: Mevalonate kinase [Methanomassiliicoccales archaeon PtaB.Bin134]|nr:MAG: Mevalonate kinase [Methanomassiliicoccales archaeon PtaB.Bin134]
MSGGLVETSAPAKVILLGEHAVVFGQPAVSVAVGLRLRCHIRPAATSSLNGQPLLPQNYSYVSACLAKRKAGPTAVTTISDFPSGSGLGSSAAVTSALLAALATSQGGMDQATVAREAFEVESEVQGRASPIDTSTCTHGGGILVKRERGDGFLWEMSRDTRRWCVHDLKVPQMTLVIGFTGKSAPTGPLVAKVKRFVDHSTFARDIVEEIGRLTLQGVDLLASGDMEGLGRIMTQDHKLLAILGVSSPELDRLVSAVLPYSYGAKLTGAGGGGSMVALTDRPEEVAEIIRRKGGQPFITVTGVPGVRIE